MICVAAERRIVRLRESGHHVILRSEMLPLLVEASPEFDSTWRDFLAYWSPVHRLTTSRSRITLGTSQRSWRGDEQTLRRVFAIIERLVVEGDEYIKEAAIVGLLEDLQNRNLHTGTRPEQFEAFLLPQSRNSWAKLQEFWDRGRLLVDD